MPIGTARKVRAGRDITLVGWGNTVLLCSRVAAALESTGVEAETTVATRVQDVCAVLDALARRVAQVPDVQPQVVADALQDAERAIAAATSGLYFAGRARWS